MRSPWFATIAIAARWHHRKGEDENLSLFRFTTNRILMSYFVYILFSASANRFYIGQTCDLKERLKQHNSSFYLGASTKGITDWEIYWFLECDSRQQALQLESHIKKMRNRTYYSNLKKYPEISLKLLKKYG